MQKLTSFITTVLYNSALNEPSHKLDGSSFDEGAERVAAILEVAATKSHSFDADPPASHDEVLRGFASFAQGFKHEVALVAWTDERHSRRFRYFDVTVGDHISVSPRIVGLCAAAATRPSSTKTRAIVIHNHPSNWLRKALLDSFDLTLGPSDADRQLLSSLRFLRDLNVRVEFWLLDGAVLRRFKAPALSRLLAWLDR